MKYSLPNLPYDYGALEPYCQGRVLGGDEPDGDLRDAIDHYFGSFASFRRQLSYATISVHGSGWGSLAWEPLGERLVVEQIHDHQSNAAVGSHPLLVIDAWEHAYYLQYQNRRAEYVENVWKVLNWPAVQARFKRSREFSLRAAALPAENLGKREASLGIGA